MLTIFMPIVSSRSLVSQPRQCEPVHEQHAQGAGHPVVVDAIDEGEPRVLHALRVHADR